jgi:hypothetical protein
LLNVCNQDGVNNYFSVTLAQGDAVANSTQYVYTNNVVAAYSTAFISPVIALSPNDAIYVSTTQKTSTQILDASGSSNTANLFISVSSGSANVTGSNTDFTTLTPGSYILVTGATPSTQQIVSITNSTSLVVASNYTAGVSGGFAYILGFGNVSYSLSGVEILAVPVISSMSASSGSNAGGDTITITGKYFTGTTSVQFGGVYANFVVNSDTSMTVTTPAVPYASTVDVIITNGGGSSSTVQADQFTYYYPLPAITSINPSVGSIYGGTSVVITGTGFAGTQIVKFGNTYCSFVLNSNTQITAVSPGVGSPQTVGISVTTSGGVSAETTADQFTFATFA